MSNKVLLAQTPAVIFERFKVHAPGSRFAYMQAQKNPGTTQDARVK